MSDYTCRSCPASPTRTPINITIVTPDQLFATPATSAAASTAGVVPAANEDSTTTMTTSTTNEQPSVQSVAAANVTNANNNNIVTIATSSSIAEAMTMVQSKGVSHVLDMSGVRAIQSAPGSPLAGQYRCYPMNGLRFELCFFTGPVLPTCVFAISYVENKLSWVLKMVQKIAQILFISKVCCMLLFLNLL